MITTEQATSYGTLLAIFISAALAEWRRSNVNKKIEAVHTLVNSNMGTQLRITAVALRQVANMTPVEPSSLKNAALDAASNAETLLADHNAKQATVDAANPPKV